VPDVLRNSVTLMLTQRKHIAICFYKQLFVDIHVFKYEVSVNLEEISFLNLHESKWPVPLWPQKQSSKSN
jgi:hypothetical protein